ncbi:MAG: hypothetical protein ABSB59_03115 [Streptosporangiaceae bacterium]|jgi:hypothetical protein
MRDDLTGRLTTGSADFAATVRPASPEAIRARGNRRRRRQMLTAAALALAIGAGGAGTAYASLGQPGRAGHGAPATGPTPASSAATGSDRPDIVAVTAHGALVVLDPLSGEARRILVAAGVAGTGVSVSPDGRTAYFAARHGCQDEIESVPVTGGRPRMITPGVLPAVSPDGKKLAFARERPSGAPAGCGYPRRDDQVVVRALAGGQETVLTSGYGAARPVPATRLSWSPDSQRLLVTAGPAPDSGSWTLAVVDPATSRYYTPSVKNGGTLVPPGNGYYYRDAAYLPDGDLFVNRVCCTGTPHRTTSTLLLEIDPRGHLIHQVAIGFLDRVHTSLGADRSGHWLLYLSGPDLFLSLDGAAPFKLTTGLAAAAWS